MTTPTTGRAAALTSLALSLTLAVAACGSDDGGGANRRPAELEDLPPLPGDELDPARSGGDIGVQACADDPQVAFHTIRNLARIGQGRVVMRWSQLGFGRTSSTSNTQETPRNLQGFKDGTNNIKAEDTDLLEEHVWVPNGDAQEWLDAGLFFICFQRDPRRQFVAIQRNLGSRDALNEYIRHTGSAVFACPGGIQPGSYVGEPLLG